MTRLYMLLLPFIIRGLGQHVEYFNAMTHSDVKVELMLGVMSQCPDAILCESVMDDVLKHVANKVHFSLSFLASINSSEPEYGVTCLHGPIECAGNIQQLCTSTYEPLSSWWQFVQCQNLQSRETIGRPEVALHCAEVVGIDWNGSKAGHCAGSSGQGNEGVKLLQESVKTSHALGIEKSCTVLISGKKVCVHDGEWKDCQAGHTPDDFVRQINSEYERLNSNVGQ